MLTLTIAIGMTFNAAEAVDQISLSTSNNIYYSGDYVVIFGAVNTIFENMPITIQIYYQSNLVDVAQVSVAQDGTFVKSFNAVGQQWKEEGTYTVRAQYTSTQIAETTFEFGGSTPTTSPPSSVTDTTVSVQGSSDLITYEMSM